MVINYRQIWKANKKPEIKLIKKQIKFTSSHWSTYTKLCQLLKTGQIDKAIKHVENWNHKGTAEIAGQLLEKIINAVHKQKETIEARTIDKFGENAGGARPALPVGNVQNPRRQEHNDRIQKLLDQEEQRRKTQATIDRAMKRAAQVEREVREQAAKQQAAEELNEKAKESPVLSKYEKEKVEEKKPFKVVGTVEQSGEDQEPDKIVIEAVQEAKAAQVVKEEVQKEIEIKQNEQDAEDHKEIQEIPKSEWSNIFNDLQKKWGIDKEEPAVMREFHGYYTKTLDEHYLTEQDIEYLRAIIQNVDGSKDLMKDKELETQLTYIADLGTVLQIYNQKLESQPDQPPKDPYEHLQGRRRWNKMLWDIQKKVGNPDSKTISNLRSDLLKVWNLQTSDYVIKNIQRDDIREKVIAIVNEKIQADSGIESLAASNQLQRKIARECFVEQFGGSIYVGNGYPREDCSPKWLIEDFEKLRVWCVAKGGSYWSSIRTNIYNSLNGQSVRDVPFDSVPYGTMRMVNPHKTSYYGIVSSEYIPDKEQIRKLLVWRREQIRKYRDGEIKRQDIQWRMPE